MRHFSGIAFLLAGLNCAPAQQYIINTFAGGVPLPTPAAAAQSPAPFPTGIAVDSSGSVYFASDTSIFKIATDGVMTRIGGNARPGYSGDGGAATSAQINAPLGLAVDAAGNVYVADSLNNRIRRISPDGMIGTVAGNGTPGYSGDGGAASSARLSGPHGVAVDAAGTLYIADTNNNRVRKVANGIITTVAGDGTAAYSGDGGPATSARLTAPMAVAVDSGGSLYIADTENYVVRKIGAAGTIATVAGNGMMGFGPGQAGAAATKISLGAVAYIAIDGQGNLFLSDASNWEIWRVSNGTISMVTGFVSVDPQVAGVAADAAGNLYVSYYGGNAILMAPPGKAAIQLAGAWHPESFLGDGGPATNGHLLNPSGLALDGAGNVYIADGENNLIRKVAPNGILTTVVGGPVAESSGPPAAGTILGPVTAVAVDGTGNIFIGVFPDGPIGLLEIPVKAGASAVVASDVYGRTNGLAVDASGSVYATECFYLQCGIRKFTSDGKSTPVAGNGTSGYTGDGGGALATAINQPAGITVDAAGSFYFADSGNHRIRKVAGGLITTVAGNGKPGFQGDGGAATSAQLNTPMGVAVDSAGNLYIADTGNNRIRKVSVNGTITTIAGIGTAAYSGDGGLAPAAQLNHPTDLVVDKAGKVYIADTPNQAIRVLSTLEPVSLATATLPDGLTGTPYSAMVAASGGAMPYSWSVTAGALPPGLALSATGAVTGTPSSAGTASFTVQVTDSTLSSAAQAFRIRVVSPLIINAVAPPDAIAGATYSQTLAASGGTPPYSWSLTGGALPAGLGLSVTGAIGGTPLEAGTFTFTVQVTDSGALSATQTFSMQAIDFRTAP